MRNTYSKYLLEELFDGRDELGERLALVVGHGLGEGEHLRGLELSAEQVEREGRALARAARRLGRRRRRLAAAASVFNLDLRILYSRI